MKFFLFLILCALLERFEAKTEIFENDFHIARMSEVGPGNILPQFLFLQGSVEGQGQSIGLGGGRGQPIPFEPDLSLDDDIWEGASEDLRSPQLPYLTQDQWTCDREPADITVITMESETLRATITPQYGGKIWALFDKVNQREMFLNNPAHQPGNIGALKAWTSGGCEWNWSPGILGHSVFSEQQVYAARVPTERGDMIRIYEFDRYNSTVWQVDMFLEDDVLWAHPKITNETPKDLRGYWWTCVAHHMTPGCRAVTPADSTVQTSSPLGWVKSDWPIFSQQVANTSFQGLDDAWGVDNSYAGNALSSVDNFVRIPPSQQKYIAHVEEDGYSVVHGHTLDGTKFFVWGENGPGRFWQDFLGGGASEEREGDYWELQIGVAPTQAQTFSIAARSSLEFTEWFKSYPADIEAVHNRNYDIAVQDVSSWIQSDDGVPAERSQDMNNFFERHSNDVITAENIVVRGSPWGALQQRLLGHQLATGVLFEEIETDESRPWIELLSSRTFGEDTLNRTPVSYVTDDHWLSALISSGETYGYTWLHHLHIGVANMERGNVESPRQSFTQSIQLRPSAVAYRNLALLSETPEDAFTLYIQAFDVALSGDTDPSHERLVCDLANEVIAFLRHRFLFAELDEFLAKIPSCCDGMDSILIAQIGVQINLHKQPEIALDILRSNCFPTMAGERTELQEMWYAAHILLEEFEVGRGLTPIEEKHVRLNNPSPRNIGCAFGSRYCTEYW